MMTADMFPDSWKQASMQAAQHTAATLQRRLPLAARQRRTAQLFLSWNTS